MNSFILLLLIVVVVLILVHDFVREARLRREMIETYGKVLEFGIVLQAILMSLSENRKNLVDKNFQKLYDEQINQAMKSYEKSKEK